MDPSWDLEHAEDPDLFRFITDAARRFLEEVGSQQLVYGVGVAPMHGRSVPLVLVDSSALDVSGRPSIRGPFPVALGDLGFTAEPLLSWELPPTTAVLPVTRPQALGAFTIPLTAGDAIRGGATLVRGTAGPVLRLSTSNRSAFLTAGHVTGTRQGAPVQRIRQRRWRSTNYEQIGEVANASDPADTPRLPGYDVAVVDIHPGVRLLIRPKAVARLPAEIRSPHSATVLGAVSGSARAALIGALMVHGDKERLWKNSWVMVPSGIATYGDSGGSVIDDDGALLGILVGGSGYPGSTAMAVQYVQDAESTQREYLDVIGVRFG